MKRARVLLSSSSSEESSPAKSADRLAKVIKLADEGDMIFEEVMIKDLFVQLNMMKRNFERNFSGLRSDIESYRLELQNDLKSLNDRADEIKSSIENAWDEINDNKSNMESSQQDMENLRATVKKTATVKPLKTELELQKQRNIILEQYIRHENIRLLFVDEEPEENTEALFSRILTEMKVY